MKKIITSLYTNNWVKVTFLLLIMIVTKKLSKTINNDFIAGCIEGIGLVAMILLIVTFTRFLIKKPTTEI